MVVKATGIWEQEDLVNHVYDATLAGALVSVYHGITSAIDLGCGPGHYCKALLMANESGIVVHGIEGTPGMSQSMSMPGFEFAIKHFDLTQDISEMLPDPYDLVLCLEVAEHIPPEHEQTFLRNIDHLCKRYLVLSWAIPGQGGIGHVNEKPGSYVAKAVEALGFKRDQTRTNILRQAATYPWFKFSLRACVRDGQR